MALAAGARVGARTAAMDVVARPNGIRAARERISTWRLHADELDHGCAICRTPPSHASRLHRCRGAHAGTWHWWHSRRIRYRATADLRPAAVRERRQRGSLLVPAKLDAAGVRAPARQ